MAAQQIEGASKTDSGASAWLKNILPRIAPSKTFVISSRCAKGPIESATSKTFSTSSRSNCLTLIICAPRKSIIESFLIASPLNCGISINISRYEYGTTSRAVIAGKI